MLTSPNPRFDCFIKILISFKAFIRLRFREGEQENNVETGKKTNRPSTTFSKEEDRVRSCDDRAVKGRKLQQMEKKQQQPPFLFIVYNSFNYLLPSACFQLHGEPGTGQSSSHACVNTYQQTSFRFFTFCRFFFCHSKGSI